MMYKPPSDSYKKEELQEANPVGVDYLVRNERTNKDFTRVMPDKRIENVKLPWGFYGYTYLNHDKAWLNERLVEVPEFKYEVDAHECGHCSWEYRTRVVIKDRVKQETREDILKRLFKLQYEKAA